MEKNTESGDQLNSYYTGREGKGAWAPHIGGRIADQLGIDTTKPPTDEGLARLFECKRADTGEKWSGDHAIQFFGHKSHISIDREFRLIRKWKTTDSATSDGARLREGLLDKTNTASNVWTDTAYRKKSQ